MPVLITLISAIGIYTLARYIQHKQDSVRRKPIPVRVDEEYPRHY